MTADQSNFADRQTARLAAARALGSTLPPRPSSSPLILTATAAPAHVARTDALSTPAPISAPAPALPDGDWLLAALDNLTTDIRMNSPQTGFTLIETLVSIALFGLLLAVLTPLATRSAEDSANALGATHAKEVVDAASRYIRDNNAAILAVAGPTTPAVIDVPTLRATGYLPTSFSATSPFGEAYQIRIIEPAAGQLQALMVGVGGDDLNDGQLRRISRLMGAEGGFISGSDSTQARGAGGGWQIATAAFAPAAGGGNVAAALFFRDGEQTTDFLYRSAVPGRPELNRMNTALDMANNDINAADDIATRTVDATNGIRAGSIGIGSNINGALPSPMESLSLPGGMNFRFVTGGVEQASIANDGTLAARNQVRAPAVRATNSVSVDQNGQLRIANRFAPATTLAIQQANNGFPSNQRELHVIAPDGSFADVGAGGVYATGYLVSEGYTQIGTASSEVYIAGGTTNFVNSAPFASVGMRIGGVPGAIRNGVCASTQWGLMSMLDTGGFGVCQWHPTLGGFRWVQPQPF